MSFGIQKLKKQARKELENNILPFWMNRMKDPQGGFYGRIDGKGNLVPGAEKGGVLNARILWTFASAYRVCGKQEYLDMALRARDEIMEKFVDKEYGGTFWSLDSEGRPLDTKKQIYSIAFTIYGLSELNRATGDGKALECAIELYRSIEEHSFDALRNGYLEALTRDWKPIEDMRLSEKDQNDAKTMNTHLHLLEAYTSLYRVWKDEGLRHQLANMINIFLDKIIMPDGHLALFFDEDWKNTTHITSFGHDIECSWLLAEAAEVLGDNCLREQVISICNRVAEASLEGWTPDGGMIYEKEIGTDAADRDRHWWVQAETVVGCLWQYKYTGADEWLVRAMAEAKFIQNEIVCPDGEWYWSRKADGTANTSDDRAGFWKCPYHNGRMCLEVLAF